MMQHQALDLIDSSINEAKRFIEKAREARESLQADELASITGNRKTGAMKRASMDLSNELVRLRRWSAYK